MIINIDKFQQINNLYGDEIGDKILLEVKEKIFDFGEKLAVVANWWVDQSPAISPFLSGSGNSELGIMCAIWNTRLIKNPVIKCIVKKASIIKYTGRSIMIKGMTRAKE